jgi:hypothetical protein
MAARGTGILEITMIRKEDIDSVIEAADKAINHERGGDFAWISKSAILERVYYLGLYAGLRPIASGNDLDSILRKALLQTMSARKFDDSFGSTPIGACFRVLASLAQKFDDLYERQLASAAQSAATFDWADTTRLHGDVQSCLSELIAKAERRDQEWQCVINDTYKGLKTFQALIDQKLSDAVEAGAAKDPGSNKQDKPSHYSRLSAHLHALQDLTRRIALLETSHDKWHGLFES